MSVRLRFAPSPTGFLHIGGLRTALYNYLLAAKHGGDFILRIEDTDQKRFVEGAEEYIIESLQWLGIEIDEGPAPHFSGNYGPYRQSERSEIYLKHALQLIEFGQAYYAFDTPEELDKMRAEKREKGIHSPTYDQEIRMEMKNSLNLSKEEVQKLLDAGIPYVIRLKVPSDETIVFSDMTKGKLRFDSNELDDKVLIKNDGLPTYHMANVVDDHLMKISHVIRGEEWISSTAHHLLLYKAFGWEEEMPRFCHLPLILKPQGKGKLSKRDGDKLGFPVFPLSFTDPKSGDEQKGFREVGFMPEALGNFLAFLGWNPGTEQEIFSMAELQESFTTDQLSKSGSRFDYKKALWYNQQYIAEQDVHALIPIVRKQLQNREINDVGQHILEHRLSSFVELMKPRVQIYPDFYEKAKFLFAPISEWDEKQIRKKWKEGSEAILSDIRNFLSAFESWNSEEISTVIKSYINDNDLSFGKVLPLMRLATAGTMKGPDLFPMLELLGKNCTLNRIEDAIREFPKRQEA